MNINILFETLAKIIGEREGIDITVVSVSANKPETGVGFGSFNQ